MTQSLFTQTGRAKSEQGRDHMALSKISNHIQHQEVLLDDTNIYWVCGFRHHSQTTITFHNWEKNVKEKYMSKKL